MEVNVGERLSSLENNIRGIFANYTEFEVQECNSNIRRRLNNLEGILNDYRVNSSSKISNSLQELQDKLNGVKRIIRDGRDEESEESLNALQQVGTELDEAIKGLEQFEIEGVRPTGQDDIRFEDDVKRVVEEATRDLIREHGITNPDIIGDIRRETIRLTEDLGRNHGELSVKMKGQIKDKVAYIGEEFVAKSKEESTKGKDDFASKLQGQTVSEEELAEKDSQNLSENRLAFKGEPARDDSNRKNLEAMFK